MHFQRQGFKRLTLNREKKRGLRLFQAIDGGDGKDRGYMGRQRGIKRGSKTVRKVENTYNWKVQQHILSVAFIKLHCVYLVD